MTAYVVNIRAEIDADNPKHAERIAADIVEDSDGFEVLSINAEGTA